MGVVLVMIWHRVLFICLFIYRSCGCFAPIVLATWHTLLYAAAVLWPFTLRLYCTFDACARSINTRWFVFCFSAFLQHFWLSLVSNSPSCSFLHIFASKCVRTIWMTDYPDLTLAVTMLAAWLTRLLCCGQNNQCPQALADSASTSEVLTSQLC